MALGMAFLLPGTVWHQASPQGFPFGILPATAAILGVLCALAPGIALKLGPRGARTGWLAALESPPDFLWGGLLLAAWPGLWGPPGRVAFALAFLAASLPTEVRWLCAALPRESPFPEAYGAAAIATTRRRALLQLMPRWVAARLPLWLTAALVLERIFGIQGLGSDWMQRIGARDQMGLAAWVIGFALLWRLTRPWEPA